MKFSANLGFLWADLPLTEAIRAAKSAGFDAVECHWPYTSDPEEVAATLRDVDLPLLGLNTYRGSAALGDNGLSALPDRIQEAREAIDQAIAFARIIGAGNIHVMAGYAEGPEAHETFVTNLRYACDRVAGHDIAILIEPLNAADAPGYFLRDTAQAARILAEVARQNARLMFDCYHVGRTEGDVIGRLRALLPLIGHIQFASVPDRGPPQPKDAAFARLFAQIADLGYDRPLGAEYRPVGPTELSLGWLANAQRGQL